MMLRCLSRPGTRRILTPMVSMESSVAVLFILSVNKVFLLIAHLSLPWSNGWVALSFLVCRSFVRPAMVTTNQISTFFIGKGSNSSENGLKLQENWSNHFFGNRSASPLEGGRGGGCPKDFLTKKNDPRKMVWNGEKIGQITFLDLALPPSGQGGGQLFKCQTFLCRPEMSTVVHYSSYI